MMKIHHISLLAIAASLCCQIGVFGTEDKDDSVRMFKEYLHIDGLLTNQHQAERQPPPHVIDDIKKERDQIAQELLRNQHEAGPALVKEYEKYRGTGMRGELMNFAMQTGIAKSDFLAFAREAILETDLSAASDPMLTTALEYLGEHGEESDLGLMARLDGHVNQTYAQIKERCSKHLRERLGLGDSARGRVATGSSWKPEVGEQRGPLGVSDAKSRSVSTSKGVQLYVVVGVAVLAVLTLLVRVFLRGRAS